MLSIIRTFSFFWICVLICGSCQLTPAVPGPDPVDPIDPVEVHLSISVPDTKGGSRVGGYISRSSFDWEDSIHILRCYVSRKSTNHILSVHDFTRSEISNNRASFVLPPFSPDSVYLFHVVANVDTLFNSVEELEGYTLSDIWSYNGSYSEVSDGSLCTSGFALSGVSEIVALPSARHLELNVDITRVVSKYSVNISLSEAFHLKYPGVLTIDSVSVLHSCSSSFLFGGSSVDFNGAAFPLTQTPSVYGSTSRVLFYLFENGPRSDSDKVRLKIGASYDEDGDPSTLDDFRELMYTLVLEGPINSGVLSRNTYYQHDVVINGFASGDLNSSFSVDPWHSKDNDEVL